MGLDESYSRMPNVAQRYRSALHYSPLRNAPIHRSESLRLVVGTSRVLARFQMGRGDGGRSSNGHPPGRVQWLIVFAR